MKFNGIYLTLAALPLFAADGRIPISAPAVITQPGNYYVTRDFSISVGYGIDIQTGDVTLDLNGHTLTHAQTAGGNFVISASAAALTAVHITNGTVVGGYYGVSVIGGPGASTEVKVDHIHARGFSNGGSGIYVSGQGGLPARAELAFNEIRNAAGTCINLSLVRGARVHDNRVSCATGIDLTGVTLSEIYNNQASYNTNYGIHSDAGCAQLNIHHNTASGCFYGLYILGNYHALDWNVAASVGLGGEIGIILAGTGTVYSNNRTPNNPGGGIVLGADTYYNGGGNLP